MHQDCQNKLAIISEELFSTDWAGRFDSYETFQGAARVSVDRILDQIEVLAKSRLETKNPPKNNQALIELLEQSEETSSQWLWASVLLKVSSIRMSMQKNLGHSAVSASIHLMHSLFRGLFEEQDRATEIKNETTNKPKAEVKQLTPKADKQPSAQTGKQTKEPSTKSRIQQTTTAAPARAQAAASTNVVLKQLVAEEEPGTEGISLSQQCHEVAEQLTEKYPEYTLTAIRVLTAEKLGVSRQYLENLGVTPKKFRS